MTDFISDPDRPPLYELFDDRGRAWLDRVVDAINDGAYDEARDAFLADEASVHGPDSEE